MYAIIRAGGHQEKVNPGDEITVDRMKKEVGDEIRFSPLMIAKDDGTVISEKSSLEEAEAAVVGTVLQHLKGDKLDVFQYRSKTGYRRHTGHRQALTLVRIAEIRLGGEIARAPEPAEEPEPAPAEAPAAEETKKPAKKAPARGAKKAPAKAAAKGGKTGPKKAPARKKR